MTFNDTLSIQMLFYPPDYYVIGDYVFDIDKDMQPIAVNDERTEEFQNEGKYEEDGSVKKPTRMWRTFGKQKNCIIFPNSKATSVVLNDGQSYVYTYEVIVKLKKSLYAYIPKQGDYVWIAKSDGTIFREMEVKGFVTLKKKYLKIWL